MAKNGRLPGSDFNYGPDATAIFLFKSKQVNGAVTHLEYDRIDLGENDLASFVLAHELGHKRKVYGKYNDDADDFEKYARNNRTIWENCFK